MVRRTPRTTPTDTPLPSTTLFRSDDPASGALEQRRVRSHREGEKRGDHQQESDRQPCASASIGKAGIARADFQQRPAHAAAVPRSIRCEKINGKGRSEERRVGKEGVRPGRARWSAEHAKKNKKKKK